jgi:hypothetical protein
MASSGAGGPGADGAAAVQVCARVCVSGERGSQCACRGILSHPQRLAKETKLIASKPVSGVRFEPGGEAAPLVWTMHVDGPEEYTVQGDRRKCPYAGHSFPVTIKFPPTYPFKNPDVCRDFCEALMYLWTALIRRYICADDVPPWTALPPQCQQRDRWGYSSVSPYDYTQLSYT